MSGGITGSGSRTLLGYTPTTVVYADVGCSQSAGIDRCDDILWMRSRSWLPDQGALRDIRGDRGKPVVGYPPERNVGVKRLPALAPDVTRVLEGRNSRSPPMKPVPNRSLRRSMILRQWYLLDFGAAGAYSHGIP